MGTSTKEIMKLAESHGEVLTGRASAEKLVVEVVDAVSQGTCVVLDLEGVRAVSPSFADELFGKLITRVDSDRVEFVNLSEHLAAVARMAEQRRRDSDNGE
jgi:hypothetical protein